MIIYFADRKFNILGHADTKLPKGRKIINDKKTEEIGTGGTVFECTLIYNDQSEFAKLKEWTDTGNFILCNGENSETEFYTIIDAESSTDTRTFYIYAESEGLNLLNSITTAYQSDQAYPIEHYINLFSKDSGFEIGINELSNLKRKLKWEGEETATSRILSVATQFGGEIKYRFQIDKLKVSHKYIDIYKKIGRSTECRLRLGKEINSIHTQKTISNLATALEVKGGTPEGEEEPVTLQGYKYDDGDFYVDGTVIKSRKALKKWSRRQWEELPGEGHIIQQFSYDTISQSELCNRAVSKLKKICDVEVNYEIDITDSPKDLKIGDTVYVIDEERKQYLSARVLKLETSECDRYRQATLGDYLLEEGGISKDLLDLAEKLEKEAIKARYTWIVYADNEQGNGISLDPKGKEYLGVAENMLTKEPNLNDPNIFRWSKVKGDSGKDGQDGQDGQDATLLRIDSSRGTVFKNNMVTTVLTVSVFKGEKRITDIEGLRKEFGPSARLEWQWQRMNEQRFGVLLDSDKKISKNGFTLTLHPEDVDTKVTFMCILLTD